MLRFGAQIAKISNRRKYPLYGSLKKMDRTRADAFFSQIILVIIECNVWSIYSDNSALSIQEAIYKLYTCLWSIVTYKLFTDCHWTPLLLWEDHYINEHSHVILSHVRDKKWYLCMLQCRMVHDNTVNSVKHHNQFFLICLITFRFINLYKIPNT